jgi:hypothetical protein
MADPSKPRTHTAYTPQRVGRKLGCWLEVGSGRIDAAGVDLFIDRLPVGGFTGFVRLVPKDAPLPDLKPQRPNSDEDEDSDD